MNLEFNKNGDKVVKKATEEIFDHVVEMRRYFHQHPEIGFDTTNTEEKVKEFLRKEGIPILPSKMGVLALIEGKDSSRMIGLRADMDALCLQEETNVPYKSKYPNKMHACGHDGHTAMLLGAAKILHDMKSDLPTNVLLIFQPAEEGPNLGGARIMLADMQEKGIADKLINLFGIHVMNNYQTGTIGSKKGALTASTDEFYIKVIGKGGHAGQPESNIDALSIGAKIVSAMESFMSRRISPFDAAVFSTGIFQAGSAINIVSDSAKIAGTIRCQKEETRAYILENLDRITKGICQAFGASCHIDIVHGLPPLINDDAAVEYAMAVAKETAGEENVLHLEKMIMGAEDFSYFAKAIPSAFLWVGSGNKEKGFTHLAHHPKFDFDEEAMKTGIAFLCNLALNI